MKRKRHERHARFAQDAKIFIQRRKASVVLPSFASSRLCVRPLFFSSHERHQPKTNGQQLWGIADQLRGPMNADEFRDDKHYALICDSPDAIFPTNHSLGSRPIENRSVPSSIPSSWRAA